MRNAGKMLERRTSRRATRGQPCPARPFLFPNLPSRVGFINVVAPLPNVAMHVEQSVVIGFLHSDRPCSIVRIVEKPGIFRQELDAQPVVAAGLAAGSTGILPLGFGRESIPATLQIISRRFHSLGVLALIVRFIAPLLLGNPLDFAEPIAVACGVVPVHGNLRASRRCGCIARYRPSERRDWPVENAGTGPS